MDKPKFIKALKSCLHQGETIKCEHFSMNRMEGEEKDFMIAYYERFIISVVINVNNYQVRIYNKTGLPSVVSITFGIPIVNDESLLMCKMSMFRMAVRTMDCKISRQNIVKKAIIECYKNGTNYNDCMISIIRSNRVDSEDCLVFHYVKGLACVSLTEGDYSCSIFKCGEMKFICNIFNVPERNRYNIIYPVSHFKESLCISNN